VSAFRPCLLIPIFDHGATIGDVVRGLAPLALPCLVVDDGSDAETQEALAKLAASHPGVELLRRARRGGRGAALKDGYRAAAARGFTHALQLDADGQHDPREAPRLMDAARRRPAALVLGEPRFDASAPLARRAGRWISRVWVWIETLSLAVRDPLCGFRCMPLAATLSVLERTPCGERMDFDPEIAVRLLWAGVPVENVPVHVRYFEDGISHFELWRDNVAISALHARLFFGMLARLPRLLFARRAGGR
jgi:glycosyltransferase involved in cell wall biosynthesis